MRQDNPDRMLVTDAFSGVNMSNDGGRTWSASNQGIITFGGFSGDAVPIFSLSIDPNNADVVWAGTQGIRGIFKSTDGGKTWARKDKGVVEDQGITFRGLTIDRRNSSTVYAAAEVGSIIWARQQRNGKEFDRVQGVVYRTTDGGENWTAIWRGDNLARYVLIEPRNSDVIYVSTGLFDREAANSDPATNSPGGVGVAKSTDGGKTWRTLGKQNGLGNLYVGTLFMNPQNPDILLAGAGNNAYPDEAGVYLSTDGGETWQKTLASPSAISSVEFALSDPLIAYAGSGSSFYRSQDGGKTWQPMSGPPITGPWGTAGSRAGVPIDFQVDPRNPDRIFANAYGGGNFLSEDGGRTWMIASRGYSGAQLHAVAVDPLNAGRLYTIGRSGVFRSLNGGDDWEGLNLGPAEGFAEWYSVALDPANPENVIMSDEHQGVLFRSIRGGIGWRIVFRHPQVNARNFEQRHGFKALVFAPSEASIVYAGMSRERNAVDQNIAGPSFGIFKSTDGGATWVESNDSNSAGQSINALAVNPKNLGTVYAGTLKGGILRSANGGQTWQVINQGLRVLDVRSLAINPQNPQVIYAGVENGGLYKSSDGGNSWQLSSNGIDPQAAIRAIAVDPTNPQIVYAADIHTGVYRSDDGGGMWVRINNGLRMRAVTSMSMSSDGSTLYAATFGEGVFRLDTAVPR